MPVNPVEYHGPHLSLHTDHILSMGLIRALHAALFPDEDLLVTADLEAGVAPTPGPGTRVTRYRALCHLLDATCDSLAELGAKRVIFITFHGAPLHNRALYRAVRSLASRSLPAVAPFQELVRLLSLGSPDDDRFLSGVPEPARAAVRRSLPLDFHAGFFETSLALHWAPTSVSEARLALPPCPDLLPSRPILWLSSLARALGASTTADELTFAAHAASWMQMRPFPGYTGHPALANPEAGQAFATAIVAHLAPLITKVFAGHPHPPPPFPWLPF